MREEQIVLFEGNEVKVKTDNGETLINLVHTAKCCGLIEPRKNNIRIRWSTIKKKLYTINSSGKSVPPQYMDEINYILNEIDETDDRNSIFMSSWLSKRLAMECHSDRAMEYKNFLATLDEKRENGQLTPTISNEQITQMVTETIKGILPTLITEVGKTFGEVVSKSKENVDNITKLMHDQATIYDNDREELKEMIGFKSANTKAMSLKLKDVLQEKYKTTIQATNEVYKKYKNKVFSEFHVCKWEDIPIKKQNEVFAYIEECLFI